MKAKIAARAAEIEKRQQVTLGHALAEPAGVSAPTILNSPIAASVQPPTSEERPRSAR